LKINIGLWWSEFVSIPKLDFAASVRAGYKSTSY